MLERNIFGLIQVHICKTKMMICVHSNGTNSIVTSQLTYHVFVRARWHSIDRVVTTHNSVSVRKHALTECEHVGLTEVELVNLSVETEPGKHQEHRQ